MVVVELCPQPAVRPLLGERQSAAGRCRWRFLHRPFCWYRRDGDQWKSLYRTAQPSLICGMP